MLTIKWIILAIICINVIAGLAITLLWLFSQKFRTWYTSTILKASFDVIEAIVEKTTEEDH